MFLYCLSIEACNINIITEIMKIHIFLHRHFCQVWFWRETTVVVWDIKNIKQIHMMMGASYTLKLSPYSCISSFVGFDHFLNTSIPVFTLSSLFYNPDTRVLIFINQDSVFYFLLKTLSLIRIDENQMLPCLDAFPTPAVCY